MITMNEKLVKQIEEFKQTLESLPKNNKKNREKYFQVLSDTIKEYSDLSNSVHEEMKRRLNLIEDKLKENESLEQQKNDIESLVKQIPLFNKYNTPYEKLNLDKTFYNFYENENKYFESIIKNIKQLIDEYQKVGITLDLESFKYSPVVYNYMKIYLQNDKPNMDELKMTFEKIYWKFPNFITHIELTFKYIYYTNQKKFNQYIDIEQDKIKKQYKESLLKTYQQYQEKYDNDYSKDIYLIVKSFKDREKNIDDYTKDKINSLLGDYINNCTTEDDRYIANIKNFEKLIKSIEEYQEYLKYLNMIEDIKNLYNEKDSFKDALKNKIKEIIKEEKKLFKLNKKVYRLEKKNKNADDIYAKIDELINNIKVLYDDLENAKFNENIYRLNDNSEIIDILKIANSYYIYQNKFYKKIDDSITLNQIEENITNLLKFIISPYNNLINNINITEETDLKETISNIYNLSEIKITKEMLEDEANIEKIKEDIAKVLIYYYISKSNISIEEIKYLCKLKDIEI